MKKVTPFLSFDGQAEEAARFYVSLLPDSRIDRVMHSPIDTPGGAAGTVLLVEFTLAGEPYMALNTPGFTFTGGGLVPDRLRGSSRDRPTLGDAHRRWRRGGRLRLVQRIAGGSSGR